MTTILADAKKGVIVCDSRITNGDTWYPATKVYRVGDALVGMAGDWKQANVWLKWFRSGKKGPPPKCEEIDALILRVEGLFKLGADCYEIPLERGYHGIGSGGAAAMGAFMAGADARKAVEIASQIDTGTGGQIHVHKLKG